MLCHAVRIAARATRAMLCPGERGLALRHTGGRLLIVPPEAIAVGLKVLGLKVLHWHTVRG